MKIISIIFIFISITVFAYGQRNGMFSNLQPMPINNINWTKNNAEQVIPIKKLFDNHNVVILSENTHYDGAIRDAQCMIIKELIEAGKINTLYLESSFLNIQELNKILRTEGMAGIEKTYPYCNSLELMYWTNCGFWRYLAQKIVDNKIELVGFDISNTSSLLIRKLYEDAQEIKNSKDSFNFDHIQMKELKDDYQNLEYNYALRFPEQKYNLHKSFCRTVISNYQYLNDTSKVRDWQIMESYFDWVYKRQFVLRESKQLSDLDKYIKEKTSYHAYRDSLMSRLFLQDYKNRNGVKAVAIMSAYHALNNFRSYAEIEKCCVAPNTSPLNEIVSKEVIDSIYSIAFVSLTGSYGQEINGKKIILGKIKPSKKSIEYYLGKTYRQPFLYLDFTSSSINSDFPAAIIFSKTISANWSKIYSGLFFVREMYPVKFITTHSQ